MPHHGDGRDMLAKDLQIVYSGWVLKKKRKKMQGESSPTQEVEG